MREFSGWVGDCDVNGGLKGFRPDSERWPVLKHGLISFKDASVACFVLNRSRGGAGLVLHSDAVLPLVFDLEIDGENIRRRCLVVWRDQCRLGVSFDIERLAEIALDHDLLADQIRREPEVLEREKSLQRLVSALRFVALAGFYRTVVLARVGAVPNALDKLDPPDRPARSRD